jgi:DNA-binding NtrC family response regulator
MLDVLLVEDDRDVRECIAVWLEDAGHHVVQAGDGALAASLLESRAFDVAICDVHLPTLGGIALARRARHLAPGMAVVMMSSAASVSEVVTSLRGGAIDFVVKPFEPERIVDQILAPLAERRSLKKRFEAARAEWVNVAVGARLVSASFAMKRVIERIAAVAPSDAAVVLVGERGTGKKTLARLIHEESARRLGPFVVVPCAALGERIVEEELAILAGRVGRDAWLREGEGGTLVLEGIDCASPRVQATLARLLSEPHNVARRNADFEPLGVRVVATSQSSLADKVESGGLLESLYYRLSAASLDVPSLRRREDDLLPLVAVVLASLAPSWATPPEIEPSAYAALTTYPFPGNVSELVWTLKYAFLMADAGPIAAVHLPPRVTSYARLEAGPGMPM